MFSGFKKSVVALLLGIVGLCAGPVGAQTASPRLLFLGISIDGRAHQAAENAVYVRLAGLDVSVVRPRELHPCEQADCLSATLVLEQADIAIMGRILRNEHACLATLWLASKNNLEKPVTQDVGCRFDSRDNELPGSLADVAAAMLDDYLKSKETLSRVPKESLSVNTNSNHTTDSKINNKTWNWRKKLFIGLGVTCVTSIATAVTLALLDGKIHTGPAPTGEVFPLGRHIAASGIVAGAAATSMLILSISQK